MTARTQLDMPSLGRPDRVEPVPSPLIDGTDAELHVFSDDGDNATLALVIGEQIVALASGFRRGAGSPHTWLDTPRSDLLGTFGGFLAAAVEDPSAAESWEILTEPASEWGDALVLAGESERS